MKAQLKSILQAAVRRIAPARAQANPAPISRVFGLERGQPIDRYYIEKFIAANRDCLHGVALEIAEPRYTQVYREQLEKIEILHVSPGTKGATIIGDLARSSELPSEIADCFICTQTYQFIYDVAAAVRGSARLLRPGGTLLATFSGISQVSRYDMDRWGEFWRFTDASVRRLMQEAFPPEAIEVVSYGNVLAAKALLDGLSVEDIEQRNWLDVTDADYPVIVGARARKALSA